MKMTTTLVLLAVLAGCKTTASQVAYDMGFSESFIRNTIGGPDYRTSDQDQSGRVQVQDGPRPRYSSWQLSQMELAKANTVQVLSRYSYRNIGEVEHLLTYAEVDGQGYYVVNAVIAEYDKPVERTRVCSINFDRWNERYFKNKVSDKLEEMFPQVKKSNPQQY